MHMSLDVYLTIKGAKVAQSSSGIFIRENGETKEITEQEWHERFPDREPVRLESREAETDEVYTANITHNLTTMADKAGIYKHLWKPEELGISTAKELIEPLQEGLIKLKKQPGYFKTFNPENGWGDYERLVRFVENFLKACIEYPNAEMSVSR